MEASIDDHYAATSTFNLPSYSKTSIVIDARRLLGEEQLLQCSKGDAPFGTTMVDVITQPINNYNRCSDDLSLTFTVLKHPLSS
ncbi:hypothetical protein PVK06_046512 [Gossypium arboreum]|uniref:Uncharacterized protein n=1 Tax=Gossypium arboreum TaxID=29729 RepID=A0ABR0MB64_GOSAR|nr:hypothetical protein PVK06_046512 [Gossypium arboreum]